MSNPSTEISQAPLEQLLDKIKVTAQSIKHNITQATSDVEVLYHLGNQQLITNFDEILTSAQSEIEKKEALKQLLADRWQDIKGTSFAYCEQPREPLNQLCQALALYISPLPKDLADCDDWQAGEGPYFILMPGLEAYNDIVSGSNIHQCRLHEFILSEDGKRYIPIYQTLRFFYEGTWKQPVHTVFTEEQMSDETIDKAADPLTNHETAQLRNHSETTTRLMHNLDILKDPNASFFNRLSQLADGLFAGSSHGGAGQSDNAAAQANEAIIEFFNYWDSLLEEMRQHYLKKVPMLGPILKRLSDPVAISQQGVNYCVGLTGGELRHEVSQHRRHLEGGEITTMRQAIQRGLTKLENALKQPGYTLNQVKKDIKPFARRVVDTPVDEQHRLIREYLHLDYPNFLLYAFEQQPAMIKTFIAAFQQSTYRSDILQQRASNGMSVLMIAAQSYPEELDGLLACCLELSNLKLKDELMATTPSGDSLSFIILQQRPQALPQLFVALRRLDKEHLFQLLAQVNAHHVTILMLTMESNADAFAKLCELIGTFAADDIATLLQLANLQGDTLLMMALRNYPHAVMPLMTLFSKCKAKDQKHLVNQVNHAGIDLPSLALNADTEYFQTILDIATDNPVSPFKTMLHSTGASFFLRASSSSAENFNIALGLLDTFPSEERTIFGQKDTHGNHLLLLTMLHQQTPPELLFNKLKSRSNIELYTLLTTKNQDGFFPLTLALTQRPSYFANIVELISCLTTEQQAIIWQQVGPNGWNPPLISSIYAPEHLPSVMNHTNDITLKASLHQSDLSGNGLFAFTAGFQREHLQNLTERIKPMSIEHRFRAFCHSNEQGDNLLSWILQQDIRLLDDVFQLMEGFTIEQKVHLFSQRNHQNQHALTFIYTQHPELFDRLFLFSHHDSKNGDRIRLFQLVNDGNDGVLAKLSTSVWFDLLSLACANQSTFYTVYHHYKTIHRDSKAELSNLLTFNDANHNNLFMLIIQNNPSLVTFMVQEIKEWLDERTQRQVMHQINDRQATVLSLAGQYTPDHVVSSLQLFLKSLDKQSTKQMMLGTTIKMHSAESLISSEILENCDAETFVQKLNKTDRENNNLLGQIIIRMPHRLPTIIETMRRLLSPEQIRQLFAHPNQQGLTLYWLVFGQPQAGYLYHQIQSVISSYDNQDRMSMLAPPAGQTMIESALKYGKTAFFTTMRWIDTFAEDKRCEIISQFWQQPSEGLQQSIAKHHIDICQQLISTTQHMPVDHVVALLLQNRQALMMALTSDYKPIKGLMCQWLLTLPQNKRFEILSNFSAEVILSLLNDEQMSLVDTLPLDQQAQLLCLKDSNGDNVLVKAFTNHHRCHNKLMNRLPLFTPQQQATLFQATEGRSTLLHTLARNNKPLFQQCLTQLQMLSSKTQFSSVNQVDKQQLTPLDYLRDSPALYGHMLNLYASLSLTDQIQLFAHKGPNGKSLLTNAPLQFRKQLFEQFVHFPQSAQIEILLSMSDNDPDSLKTLIESSPWLQVQLLDIIQAFPKHIKGHICLKNTDNGCNLIWWMINRHDDNSKKQAITLMTGLAKTDVSTLFIQQDRRNGDNLLQTLAKNSPLLFDKAFSIFMALPVENKTAIIAQQNRNNMSLLGDLVKLKCYDQFDQLCKTVAQLPHDDKVRILSTSGIVPIEKTTLWVSLLYDAPHSKNFIHLMNNKAFYPAMFHLLQTLPAQTQLTILTNRSSGGKTIIDEIAEPEQSQLRFVLKQAKAFAEAKKLLAKMAAMIPNEQIHAPESNLYQLLTHRLDVYQSTYYKTVKHIHDLANDWATDIQVTWPQIENTLTYSDILMGILKLAACILMPVYGGYKLYEKVSTNRHVLFQSNRENIMYRLEDIAIEVEQTAMVQLEISRTV